jgi:hypothetical protein
MFFPKLEHLINYPGMNEFIINKFDQWLASQPYAYYEYLNPNAFINDSKINRTLGLKIFALASKIDYFKQFSEEPLMKIKYIIHCPSCDESYKTYYNKSEIPNDFIHCFNDICDPFNPKWIPHKIEVYYELKEEPHLLEDDLLDVYLSSDFPPLLADDKDQLSIFYELEERGYND